MTLSRTAWLPRGGPIPRRTPLAPQRDGTTREKRSQPRRDTGPTRDVRQLVAARSAGVCERCGTATATNVHHRRARGLGGSRRTDTNLTSNLLHLCGSGTTGCHGWVESNRNAAVVFGLLVQQHQSPTWTPVLYRGSWVLLDDDGGLRQDGDAA